MATITAVFNDFVFRLSTLTWADALDLLLVTLTFYAFFLLVRRSQAASILRGLFILGAIFLAVTLFLPLPTFGAVVQVAAIASLVVIPVILQPELRRWLERLGRNKGLFGPTQLTYAEQNTRAILKAVEGLSATECGALIAIEARDSLDSIAKSGVPIGGQVTAELLGSLFYGENPLHDGAVIIRDDKVKAAGCVLPLGQSAPVAHRRLGTRHRAALGLSEVSDALAVVVSEETGAVSTARYGQLNHGISADQLRTQLVSFYTDNELAASGRGLFGRRPFFPPEGPKLTLRDILWHVGYLLLSLLLALGLWSAVAAQINPIRQITVTGVPLSLTNKPDEWIVTSPIPQTVAVRVQTDELTQATIGPQSFQATVDLTNATLGLQRISVEVETSVENARVLGSEPAQVDVNLSESKTVTIPVTVSVADPETIPPSYQLVGKPQASPVSVEVTGSTTAVDAVARAEVTLLLNGTTTSVRTVLPVSLVDEAGNIVPGVSAEPNQALVTATIRRENNVQDVGVRVVTEGSPPEGYWLSSVGSEPSSVTLRGDPSDLAEVGSFVEVAPVDISEIQGEFTTEAPLILPEGVDAIDSSGRAITTVAVYIQTTPLTGELVLTREVVVQGLPSDAAVSVDPPTVQLLLSGPVPTLIEIESNPELVQVLVDAATLEPGATATLTPEVIAPMGLEIQLIDDSVVVSRAS